MQEVVIGRIGLHRMMGILTGGEIYSNKKRKKCGVSDGKQNFLFH